MVSDESHLSDRELLLASDGELPAAHAARVQSHLEACWTCRARKQEFESAIGEFVHSVRRSCDPHLPPAEGPRALLKAQLAQLAEARQTAPRIASVPLHWALAAATVALAILATLLVRNISERHAARLNAALIPNPVLTPGATVRLNQREICQATSPNDRVVPAALRRRVFDEYGIAAREPVAYEVDYLITPALGGADDIHNLWPQPSRATVWNAQVKDALEDRLRAMVCDGQLDLETAQRDLATNWIEAYKKYFRTDRPLASSQE